MIIKAISSEKKSTQKLSTNFYQQKKKKDLKQAFWIWSIENQKQYKSFILQASQFKESKTKAHNMSLVAVITNKEIGYPWTKYPDICNCKVKFLDNFNPTIPLSYFLWLFILIITPVLQFLYHTPSVWDHIWITS